MVIVGFATYSPPFIAPHLLIYGVFSSTGGATIKAPTNGWTTPQLADIFLTTPTNSSIAMLPGSNKQSTSTNKTGIIAGVTVGGIIIIIFVVVGLIWCFYPELIPKSCRKRGAPQNPAPEKFAPGGPASGELASGGTTSGKSVPAPGTPIPPLAEPFSDPYDRDPFANETRVGK
jgi:hypothetical protein